MTGYRKRIGKKGKTYTLSYTQRKTLNKKLAKGKEDAKWLREYDKWYAIQRQVSQVHPISSYVAVSKQQHKQSVDGIKKIIALTLKDRTSKIK